MRAGLLFPLVLLAACGRSPSEQPHRGEGAGAALEAAAIRTGLIADPASRALGGIWARDTDKACVVPHGSDDAAIGLLVDYGQGQGCVATGTAHRRGGDRLDLTLGDGCRLNARFDGERIVLPAEVPPGCEARCTGRASLAAMTVERQSGSIAEALSLRAPSGRRLCAG